MGKTFTFEWLRSDMTETEKAYGFMVDGNRSVNVHRRQYVSFEWLPKSQIQVEDVTFEEYAEIHGERHAQLFYSEGTVIVSVPMWLARGHNYFKALGF